MGNYNLDIKQIRKENKLTQAQFAEKIGVTEKSVSKWETDRGKPSRENILKICQLFNINVVKVDPNLKREIRTCKIYTTIVCTLLIALIIFMSLPIYKDNSREIMIDWELVTNNQKSPYLYSFFSFKIDSLPFIFSSLNIIIGALLLIGYILFRKRYSYLSILNIILFAHSLLLLIILILLKSALIKFKLVITLLIVAQLVSTIIFMVNDIFVRRKQHDFSRRIR